MKIALLALYSFGSLPRQWPVPPPPEFSDVEFVFGRTDGDEDLIIVFNALDARTVVNIPPDRIWAMIQEPPDRAMRYLYRWQRAFSRIYVPDRLGRRDARLVSYWGALEWHIGRSYDELRQEDYPAKTADLAWVTSNLSFLPGHQLRMDFLRRLQASGLEVDLWGRGLRPVPRKWDALAPSRYAIAFENFGRGVYWSEKLSDCFLAWTTPFYYGASDISRYFPSGSYVAIDPDDPLVFERMRDVVASPFHEDNRAALEEARELCLTKYNTLDLIASEAKKAGVSRLARRNVVIEKVHSPRPNPLHLADVAVRNALKPYMPAWMLAGYRRWRDRR